MAPRKTTRAAETFELSPILDIKAAAPLHAELLARRGKAVALDASNVQRLGGQCLQVLIAAFAAWRADRKALTISSPSDAFRESLALLGFTVESLTAKDA
jgi:chemotaxis protein CheX